MRLYPCAEILFFSSSGREKGSLKHTFKEPPLSLSPSSSFCLDGPFQICRQVFGGHLQRITIAFVFSDNKLESHVSTKSDFQLATHRSSIKLKPPSTLPSIVRNPKTTSPLLFQIWATISLPISLNLPTPPPDLFPTFHLGTLAA